MMPVFDYLPRAYRRLESFMRSLFLVFFVATLP